MGRSTGTVGERWATFGGGVALGSWGAEPLFIYFELVNVKLEIGLGLFIGVSGMALVSAFIKTVRETNWAEVWTGIFKGFGGRK